MPELVWQEFFVIAVALAAGGMVKGLTGLGLPMVAVPVLAGFLSVERAVMIMIVPVLVLNIWLSWSLRDCRKDVPELRRVLLPSLPGILLGAGVLYFASERLLATGLAIWILVYLIWRLFNPTMKLADGTRRRVAPAVGFGAGVMQAATGISAPVLVPFVDGLNLSPRGYVFTVATVFSVLSGTHFIVMMLLQAYSLEQLTESIVAVIPAIVFVPLGSKLRNVIEPEVFTRIIRVLMFIIAIRLIYGAWSS